MPFIVNRFVKPIKIACEPPKKGTICVVSGWGVDGTNQTNTFLKKASITIGSQLRGKEAKPIIVEGKNEDKTGWFCHGDEGGPLMCGDRLAGIVDKYDNEGESESDKNNPEYCPQAERYYVSVTSYKEWLKENGYKSSLH